MHDILIDLPKLMQLQALNGFLNFSEMTTPPPLPPRFHGDCFKKLREEAQKYERARLTSCWRYSPVKHVEVLIYALLAKAGVYHEYEKT